MPIKNSRLKTNWLFYSLKCNCKCRNTKNQQIWNRVCIISQGINTL